MLQRSNRSSSRPLSGRSSKSYQVWGRRLPVVNGVNIRRSKTPKIWRLFAPATHQAQPRTTVNNNRRSKSKSLFTNHRGSKNRSPVNPSQLTDHDSRLRDNLRNGLAVRAASEERFRSQFLAKQSLSDSRLKRTASEEGRRRGTIVSKDLFAAVGLELASLEESRRLAVRNSYDRSGIKRAGSLESQRNYKADDSIVPRNKNEVFSEQRRVDGSPVDKDLRTMNEKRGRRQYEDRSVGLRLQRSCWVCETPVGGSERSVRCQRCRKSWHGSCFDDETEAMFAFICSKSGNVEGWNCQNCRKAIGAGDDVDYRPNSTILERQKSHQILNIHQSSESDHIGQQQQVQNNAFFKTPLRKLSFDRQRTNMKRRSASFVEAEGLKNPAVNRIVVSGLPYHENLTDQQYFEEICRKFLNIEADVGYCKRLRPSNRPESANKAPCLVVICKNQEIGRKIIKSARRLRSASDDFIRINVYINPFLTQDQIARTRELRRQKRIKKIQGYTYLESIVRNKESEWNSSSTANNSFVNGFPSQDQVNENRPAIGHFIEDNNAVMSTCADFSPKSNLLSSSHGDFANQENKTIGRLTKKVLLPDPYNASYNTIDSFNPTSKLKESHNFQNNFENLSQFQQQNDYENFLENQLTDETNRAMIRRSEGQVNIYSTEVNNVSSQNQNVFVNSSVDRLYEINNNYNDSISKYGLSTTLNQKNGFETELKVFNTNFKNKHTFYQYKPDKEKSQSQSISRITYKFPQKKYNNSNKTSNNNEQYQVNINSNQNNSSANTFLTASENHYEKPQQTCINDNLTSHHYPYNFGVVNHSPSMSSNFTNTPAYEITNDEISKFYMELSKESRVNESWKQPKFPSVTKPKEPEFVTTKQNAYYNSYDNYNLSSDTYRSNDNSKLNQRAADLSDSLPQNSSRSRNNQPYNRAVIQTAESFPNHEVNYNNLSATNSNGYLDTVSAGKDFKDDANQADLNKILLQQLHQQQLQLQQLLEKVLKK